MKVKNGIFGIFFLLLCCSGCHSVNTITGPNLDNRNFKILKARATSVKYGFKILGLIPIIYPSHSEAVKEIYDSVGESFEGRAVTLANRTEERTGNWFILFSLPKLTISADVVEFYDNKTISQ